MALLWMAQRHLSLMRALSSLALSTAVASPIGERIPSKEPLEGASRGRDLSANANCSLATASAFCRMTRALEHPSRVGGRRCRGVTSRVGTLKIIARKAVLCTSPREATRTGKKKKSEEGTVLGAAPAVLARAQPTHRTRQALSGQIRSAALACWTLARDASERTSRDVCCFRRHRKGHSSKYSSSFPFSLPSAQR